MEGRNTIADREAPVRLLKSEKDIAENRKAVGNLPRRTGILEHLHHLEKNKNSSSVHLDSKHVTEWQLVNDNCSSETLSIKELFVSSELQFTQPSEITGYTDNREMSEDDTGSFPAHQQVCQTSEVNNPNYGNKPSFHNQVPIISNADQTGQESFCQGWSLSKNALIPCTSDLGKPVMHKTQIMTLKDKQQYSQVKFSDLTISQEDREGNECLTELSQVKTLESGLENGQSEHSVQVDPVENLIEQLKREIALLRAQVRHQYSMCMFVSVAII